jgi:hypothetical protein
MPFMHAKRTGFCVVIARDVVGNRNPESATAFPNARGAFCDDDDKRIERTIT